MFVFALVAVSLLSIFGSMLSALVLTWILALDVDKYGYFMVPAGLIAIGLNFIIWQGVNP